jgi:2-hydroxymuconate-semialdehyde hydrolase
VLANEKTSQVERSVRVDGLNVRYLEHGKGAPVLLLHGASLGSSSDVWTRNLPALAAHRLRAIAPDLPGFGLTDHPEDHSTAYRKRFILAFLDALGIERAFLVGHSQAGRLAVDLAFSDPQRIAKVVVLGTGSLLPPLPEKKEPASEGDEGTANEPTLAETRAMLEANLYHHDLITPETLEIRQRMSVGKNFQAFLLRKQAGRDKSAKSGEPPWQRLPRCPVPLLLLYGEQDRGGAAQRAALAKQLHPAVNLQLLAQCKHLVQWDAAEAFAELAGAFLTAK